MLKKEGIYSAPYLYFGFYPRLYTQQQLNPTELYRDYMRTYVERDVRQLINIKNLVQFQKLMKLLAGRVGQILNINDLCNSVGISHHTANEWLSVLEESFLIFRLAPYYENFGKRLIKSPKIYFTDVWFAAYLLGIDDVRQIETHSQRGNLFENLVLLEIIKSRYNQAKDHNCYYYRDSNQNEVDVIFSQANRLIPIEIKSAQTFNKSFMKSLDYFRQLTTSRSPFGLLVYAGENEQAIRDCELVNYKNSIRLLQKKIIGLE